MNEKTIIEKLDSLLAQYKTTKVDTDERFWVSADIMSLWKEVTNGDDVSLVANVHRHPGVSDVLVEVIKSHPDVESFLKGSLWHPEPLDKPWLDVGSLVNVKMKVFNRHVAVGQQVFDIVESGPRIITSIGWSTKENVWSIETFGDELPTGIEVEPGYSRTGIIDIGKVYAEAPETIEVLGHAA
ncbi:TPA: hypothetical protein HA278_01330 [Candidatus Woesearchaeota archaeon]|nr:hypothetical protein [Candidatus Woesearchaeota archaeon]